MEKILQCICRFVEIDKQPFHINIFIVTIDDTDMYGGHGQKVTFQNF